MSIIGFKVHKKQVICKNLVYFSLGKFYFEKKIIIHLLEGKLALTSSGRPRCCFTSIIIVVVVRCIVVVVRFKLNPHILDQSFSQIVIYIFEWLQIYSIVSVAKKRRIRFFFLYKIIKLSSFCRKLKLATIDFRYSVFSKQDTLNIFFPHKHQNCLDLRSKLGKCIGI